MIYALMGHSHCRIQILTFPQCQVLISTMNKKLRTLFALLTAAFALLIGLSDYFGWTDYISGRRAAQQGITRLSSTKGYPKIIIFDDEKEFKPLWKIIRYNTRDDITLSKYRDGKIPTAIVRLGGTLTVPYVGEMPEDGPDPRFVPDSSPVLVFYNYKRGVEPDQSVPKDEKIARPIGNIGDLKSWVQGSKETERFIFSIVLIGLLSVTLAFLEWRETSRQLFK